MALYTQPAHTPGAGAKRSVLSEILQFLVMGALVLILTGMPNRADCDENWPKFRHDLNNTGHSNWTAPTTNEIIWMDDLGHTADMCSSPSVAYGLVYIGSYNDTIYCVNATSGDSVWAYPTGGNVCSTPTVAGPEGAAKVFVGSYDGYVYCLDAEDGTFIWRTNIGNAQGDYIDSSPAVTLVSGEPDRVYIGSTNGHVYCLDADNGAQIWDYETGYQAVNSSPAVSGGWVYVGAGSYLGGPYAGALFCLDAQGSGGTTTHRWIFAVAGEWVWSSPTVVGNLVYFASAERVWCLDVNASNEERVVWAYKDYSHVNVFLSSPAVAYDRVYIGSGDDRVYCLDAVGNGDHTTDMLWTFDTVGGVESSPAVVDSLVFVGEGSHYSFGNYLYCLDAFGNPDSTTNLIWQLDVCTMPYQKHYSPAVANGLVYTSTNCGSLKLTAIGSRLSCDVSSTALDFGSVDVNEYADRSFTITNDGFDPLTGSVSEACDHYTIISGGGAYSLDPGEWLDVTVRYEPTEMGSHNCMIDTDQERCGYVSCTGISENILIPTLSEWGMIIMILLLLTAGVIVFRRRIAAEQRG